MYLTNKGYRDATKPLLERLLAEHREDLVIAMPPGGLFAEYKRVLDRSHPDVVTVWLRDRAEHIFDRIIFTDDNDVLITKPVVNEENAWWYLDDIRKDLEYYRRTHSKAAVHFDIAGRDAQGAADALAETLQASDTHCT